MSAVLADFPAALLITLAFFALIAIAEAITRWYSPSPESTRKLVHLGGGMVCLTFPFQLTSHWTVLLMAVGMATFFFFGSRYQALHSLTRVGRKTHGSEFYPLAVWAVFYLSLGTPWLFLCSLLVLAVADAAAALVGSRYGTIRYTVELEQKSLEGSAVFFLLAFLAIEIPLLVLAPLGRVEVLLASLLVAGVVTCIEAVARDGRDNIFIPVAVCLILAKLSGKPFAELVYQVGSFFFLGAVVAGLLRRSRRFNVGGALVCILFVYACWSLGSEVWALPTLFGVLLLNYFRTGAKNIDGPLTEKPLLRVSHTVCILLVPMCVLVAANITGHYREWFGPFVAAVCAGLLLLAVTESRAEAARRVGARLAPVVWVGGCLVPWLGQRQESLMPTAATLLLLAVVGLLVSVFVERRMREPLRLAPAIGWVCAAAVYFAQQAGLPLWEPATDSIMMELHRAKSSQEEAKAGPPLRLRGAAPQQS